MENAVSFSGRCGMEKKTGQAAAEICGAVIGAGFASGREIDSFFTRFGVWSWLGIAAAVAMMGFMTLGVMRRPDMAGIPKRWQGKIMGHVWRAAFTALMVITGGAMTAGAGEIAALMLPMHGAYVLGMAGTLILAWLLSGRELSVLPAVSKGLIACLIAVAAAGLFLPAEKAAVVAAQGSGADGVRSVVHGISYGGFNVALAAPVMAVCSAPLTEREEKHCAAYVTLILAVLLLCGNAVLMRHSALRGESLPFIRLTASLGKAGYVLGGVSLYLAVLTTLAASLRGLEALLPKGRQWRIGGAAAIALAAGTGFEKMVAVAYPFLGGGCFILLMAALCGEKT